MKILKYKKKSNGVYIISFDNEDRIELYEDVILKNNLLIKKEIDDTLYKKILEENKNYGTYYVALSYIKKKIRAVFEVREYLVKKEYKIDSINDSIKRLLHEGYLDDKGYVKAYISDGLKFSNKGPESIKRELLEKKIDINIINECIENIDNNLLQQKLEKQVQKAVNNNHKYSGNLLRQNIISKYIKLGYSLSMINDILDNIEFKEDNELLNKEYSKLFNKYKNKYDKNKLNLVLKQKLYQKGYSIESINSLLNSK